MEVSQQGLELIKRSEGFRGRIYKDANGFPTIGYGHRVTAQQAWPDGIAEPEAAAILAADIREAEQAVQRLVRVPLTQGQFDGLVDFCFNLGAKRLAASTLLADLNLGRYNAAAEQLLLWDHAGARELPALSARRQAEFQLWHSNPEEAQPAV
jgi:lysozyme